MPDAPHTPTPLKIVSGPSLEDWSVTFGMPPGCAYFAIGPSDDEDPIAFVVERYGDRKDKAKHNAAFIVRACNAHEELVAAIRKYLEVFDRCGGSESVSASEFASARAGLRKAIPQSTGGEV